MKIIVHFFIITYCFSQLANLPILPQLPVIPTIPKMPNLRNIAQLSHIFQISQISQIGKLSSLSNLGSLNQLNYLSKLKHHKNRYKKEVYDQTKVINVTVPELLKISEKKYSVKWAIPLPSRENGSHSFGSFNTNEYDSYDDYDSDTSTVSKETNFYINVDNNEVTLVTYSGNSAIRYKKSKIYELGTLSLDDSYNFLKDLQKKLDKSAHLILLLSKHNKPDETFEIGSLKKSEKKEMLYGIASIKSKKSLAFLEQEFDKNDSYDFRDQICFAYHTDGSKEAMANLVGIIKNSNLENKVKKQAIFWLSQSASLKMEHLFKEIIYSDDDLEIKKEAVFALSQKKDYKSLKEVAKNSKDSRIRKDAIFWLGQGGVENLEFLEDLIND
jgi:hypothetical protein